MTIQAIETEYAGCLFRSRLEARWAVFFDTLKIKWEYEPQGVEVGWRLSLNDGKFPYLPDFWLPDLDMWAEVKGSLTWPEADRLLNAAASLSCNNGGGCHDHGGNDLVVLGPIPDPRRSAYPTRLHMHKGDLQASPYSFMDSGTGCCGNDYRLVGRDVGGAYETDIAWDMGLRAASRDYTQYKIIEILLNGMPATWRPLDNRIAAAFRAARSARFEHGQSGASL